MFRFMFIIFNFRFINALSKSLLAGRGSSSFPGKYKNPYSSLLVRISPASKSISRLLLPASSMVPGKCNTVDRRSCPTAGAEIRGKCYSSGGFELTPSLPQCIFSPGEEKCPRPATKLLLSALIKA